MGRNKKHKECGMILKRRTLENKAYVKNGAVRMVFFAAAIIAQILWLIMVIGRLQMDYPWVTPLISVLTLAVVIMIYGRHENSAMKLLWMLLIMTFPPLGLILYLVTGLSGTTRAMKRRFASIDRRLLPFMPAKPSDLPPLPAQAAGISHAIAGAGFPAYANTEVTFFPDPPLALNALKEDLSRAEHFIFMEYYAIEDKEIFEGILDILRERARAGVDVRLFYDDIGSVFFINTDFARRMEQEGIRCRIFNPMLPLTNIFMNNRDHRKMTIIDGKIGYTGGYNLANEYFHLTEPYGHWKDTGLRLCGGAVHTMTYLFLEMWNAIRRSKIDTQAFAPLFPPQMPSNPALGFVQPYADSPLVFENIGENVYMNILGSAQHYCWFTTPYLIITDEMARAFTLAAGRGVDVRIITPGIPDKKLTYRVTRSSYRILARSGVRIFEYTPGFCHAKQCVCDDRMAVCGTINLDYRSLYHHFEDGVFMADCPAVAAIRQDFDALFPQCQEQTEKYAKPVPFAVRLWETLLRLIAPLL